MKKYVLFSLLCLGITSFSQTWDTVGTAKFSPRAGKPSMAISQNELLIAYSEVFGDGFTVKKYDGFNDQWIDNASSTADVRGAGDIDLRFDNSGIPYATTNLVQGTKLMYRLGGTSTGANWRPQNASSGSITGNVGAGLEQEIAFNNNDSIFVAYIDRNNGNKVTVRKHLGFNQWQTIGGALFSDSSASNLTLKFGTDNQPYVAFKDSKVDGKATVLTFDGIDWIPVGTKGFTPDQANDLTMDIDSSGTIYVAYSDPGSSSWAKVMKFDGAQWVNVGSSSVTNFRTSKVDIATYNNQPYIAFQDAENGFKPTVMKFNGTTWDTLGVRGFGSRLNTLDLSIDPYNGLPYLAYTDYASSDQLVVFRFGCVESFSQIDVSKCSSYTSPSGKNYLTSGVYKDTIQNRIGCDSIITINLSIIQEDRTVLGTQTTICDNSIAQLTVPNSIDGVSYVVRQNSNSSPVSGEFLGTGASLLLDFAPVTSVNDYHVLQYQNLPLATNGGLNFPQTGNNHVRVTSAQNLPRGNDPFSVEFWFNRKSNNTSGTIVQFGALNPLFGTEINWIGLNFNGQIVNKIADREYKVNIGGTAGQWVHYCLTYDGTELKMYVNGVLSQTSPIIRQPNVVQAGNLYMGYGRNNQFQGILDEVRVWNGERTGQEIADHKDVSLVGDEANLVSYYKFEDGTGSTTAVDASNSGNDGTLINKQPSIDWVASKEGLLYTCSHQLSTVISLNVTPLNSIDQTFTTLSDSLVSNEATADSYEWFECSATGNSPINGASLQGLKINQSGDYGVKIVKGACEVSTSCENVMITSIFKDQKVNDFIYPNPARSVLYTEVGQLQIIDAVGNRVLTQESNGRVDISHLEAGVYIAILGGKKAKLIIE